MAQQIAVADCSGLGQVSDQGMMAASSLIFTHVAHVPQQCNDVHEQTKVVFEE